MAETLLAFKAGRAFRREGTNIVEPSPTKGAIIVSNGDDGLLHFTWKNRTTGVVDEDLILFPSDASFVEVAQSPSGRVYVLKFASSNQRHFFWMQDASSARDEEFARNLNGLLEDPEFTVTWDQAEASTSSQGSSSQQSAAQVADISSILSRFRHGGTATTFEGPDFALSDILTPANLTPLFSSHPELIPALFPHLPPDLPVPPSAEALTQIINSPQFRAAVSSFDQALRTGLLGGMVRSLGLPEEAGTGLEPFLRAVQEQADNDNDGDSMDTD